MVGAFFKGFAEGAARGATKVIKQDLEESQKLVDEISKETYTKMLINRNKYKEDLKEFEKNITTLAGQLGEGSKGFDVARALLNTYHTVEAATVAGNKIIEDAKTLGVTPYVWATDNKFGLGMQGEEINAATNREDIAYQIAVNNVSKPSDLAMLSDGDQVPIDKNGWAGILTGKNLQQRVSDQLAFRKMGLPDMSNKNPNMALPPAFTSGRIRIPLDISEPLKTRLSNEIKRLSFYTRTLKEDGPNLNKQERTLLEAKIEIGNNNIADIRESIKMSEDPPDTLRKRLSDVQIKIADLLKKSEGANKLDTEDAILLEKLKGEQFTLTEMIVESDRNLDPKLFKPLEINSTVFKNNIEWKLKHAPHRDIDGTPADKDNVTKLIRTGLQNGTIDPKNLPRYVFDDNGEYSDTLMNMDPNNTKLVKWFNQPSHRSAQNYIREALTSHIRGHQFLTFDALQILNDSAFLVDNKDLQELLGMAKNSSRFLHNIKPLDNTNTSSSSNNIATSTSTVVPVIKAGQPSGSDVPVTESDTLDRYPAPDDMGLEDADPKSDSLDRYPAPGDMGLEDAEPKKITKQAVWDYAEKINLPLQSKIIQMAKSENGKIKARNKVIDVLSGLKKSWPNRYKAVADQIVTELLNTSRKKESQTLKTLGEAGEHVTNKTEGFIDSVGDTLKSYFTSGPTNVKKWKEEKEASKKALLERVKKQQGYQK